MKKIFLTLFIVLFTVSVFSVGIISPKGLILKKTTVTDVAYTLLDTVKSGTTVMMDNAIANVLTIPTNAVNPVPIFSSFQIQQIGVGTTSVTADAAVTLNSVVAGTIVIPNKYAILLLTKIATDEWLLQIQDPYTYTAPLVNTSGVVSMPAATNAIAGYATAAHITAIEANTAKVTNATHSGEVTGSGALTITSGAVTLAKMADMATASIIGRNTAGTGVPEILSAATVKSILSLDNVDNTSDANKPVSTATQTQLDNKRSIVASNYAEMYLNNNANASVIETASIPIALRHFTTGSLDNWTFDAGSTGAITAYADGTGKVNVTSATHNLVTGDIITIRGTTNYNGIWSVTYIDANNFSILDTWVADDGASDWDEGSHLIAGTNAAGVYKLSWNMSTSEGGGAGSNVLVQVYINVTADIKSIARRKYPTNDQGSTGGGCLVTIADSDKVYITAQSSGNNDITNQYGNISLTRN